MCTHTCASSRAGTASGPRAVHLPERVLFYLLPSSQQTRPGPASCPAPNPLPPHISSAQRRSLGLWEAQDGRYKDRLRAAQGSFLTGMKSTMSLPVFLLANRISPTGSVPEVVSATGNQARAAPAPQPRPASKAGRKDGPCSPSVFWPLGPTPHAVPGSLRVHGPGRTSVLRSPFPRCPPEKEDSSLLGSPQQRGCQFSLESSLSHPPCEGSAILPSSR